MREWASKVYTGIMPQLTVIQPKIDYHETDPDQLRHFAKKNELERKFFK